MNKQIISALSFLVFAISSTVSEASIWTMHIGGAEVTNSGSNDIANDAIVLSFDDSIAANAVRLTIDFVGGSGVDNNAFLNDLVLNVDDNLTGLTFAHVSGVAALNESYSVNGESLSPESGFDIDFDFPPPTGAQKFFVGMSSTYDIFATGIERTSFDFANPNNFKAYVHINAVDNGGSGKYGDTGDTTSGFTSSIPEPTSVTVWLCLAGIACVRRKRP